eukprot:scaffold35220_cov34-Tisochrysis_lutea.AAC.1
MNVHHERFTEIKNLDLVGALEALFIESSWNFKIVNSGTSPPSLARAFGARDSGCRRAPSEMASPVPLPLLQYLDH